MTINWYKKLQEVDRNTPIIGVACGGVLFSHLSELKKELDYEYNASTMSTKFTAWTMNRVYFPGEYNGMSWLENVPRNPCDEATEPVGGG